jgi:hypothetical protein
MSASPEEKDARIAALLAEVEAVKRRDAEFRAHMVHEFLDRGERNTYLHTLREQLAALRKRDQEFSSDLEILTRKLEAEGERADGLAAQLARIKGTLFWRLHSHFLPHDYMEPPAAKPSPGAPGVEGAAFTYFLHTSPFRIYREPTFTLKGWAWPDDGRAVTAVRVNLGGRLFDGKIGIEEPEVIARHGPQAANPRPGFEITFDTPPGRQSLCLEAQLGGTEWRSIMRTTIWCEPARP